MRLARAARADGRRPRYGDGRPVTIEIHLPRSATFLLPFAPHKAACMSLKLNLLSVIEQRSVLPICRSRAEQLGSLQHTSTGFLIEKKMFSIPPLLVCFELSNAGSTLKGTFFFVISVLCSCIDNAVLAPPNKSINQPHLSIS